MKLKGLILLGIVSFSAAALWKMPASFAYQHIPHGNIQAQGISGTIWYGKAEQISFKKITVNNVSWAFNPIESLKSVALKTQIQIQDADLSANGLAGVNLSQTLYLENAQIEISAAFIAKLQRMAKLKGDIEAKITYLELAKGVLPIIDANIHWKQGELITPIRIRPAGDYSLIITPDNNKGLNAKINSHKAPLILEGEANIDSQWKYNTNIKIKATPANQGIMNMLKMVIGKLEKDGSAIIKQQGQLTAFY